MTPWLIIAGDFVTTGGMDAANHALASYLARTGRRVRLVAHRVDAALASLPGVSVTTVPRPLHSHALGFPLLARAGRGAARTPGQHVVVNGGNARIQGAVVWTHYVHAAFRPRHAGSPLRAAWAHAARATALADERWTARHARLVIANSALTAGHAETLLGAEGARIRVVRYGADPARFRPPTEAERADARAALGVGDRAVLGFVGALGDHRKGFDTLAAAWERLCADPAWDAVLLVVGSGAALERWRSWAGRSGAGDRVRFLGFQGDVRGVLWGCDGFVAPARYEAYGLAVQEAVCCGLAPVVSAAAGVAEFLPGSLAPLLLPDPEDAEGLADRLRLWRSERERWRAAAAGASRALSAWGWDDMAARIAALVEGGAA